MFNDIVDIIPQNEGENQREIQGEKTTTHVPEHAVFNKNLWLDKVKELRESINERFDNEGKVDRIVKMLRKVEEEALNTAPARGAIKKKAGKLKEGIALKNILGTKRERFSKTRNPKATTKRQRRRGLTWGIESRS